MLGLRRRVWSFARALLGLALMSGTVAWAGENPPPGPDWKRDWPTAKRAALREGKPVFLYFTKTY